MWNISSEIVFLFLCRSFRNALLRNIQFWRTHSPALLGLAHQMKHWLEVANAWEGKADAILQPASWDNDFIHLQEFAH